MKLSITRLYQLPVSAKEKKQTISHVDVVDENDVIVHDFHILELPFLNNKVRKSCIPAGTYTAVKHNSPKFGKTFWVKNVPGRSEILIHAGNIHEHTLGCLLPGYELEDINNDGLEDVIRSGEVMKWLNENMPDEFEVDIKWRS